MAENLPGTRWRNGRDGVLDAPWAADPALLPGLLPIAIAGAHPGLDGNHRTSTFANATDTQLRAMGVADADISAIRAGLENSPHHAARAIDAAFSRLDPNSDTARPAQAELSQGGNTPATASAVDDGSGSPSPAGDNVPTITANADGTFRVTDADGNEIGTANDADGARRLAEGSNGIQRATMDGDGAPGRRKSGSDETFSPDAPLSSQIRSLFAEPLNPANFETYHESRPSVLEIARQTGIEIVRPLGSGEISRDQGIHTGRLGETLGIEIIYYRGGPAKDLGFTPAGNPELIFLHVGSVHANIPTKWVFPHELLHVAQKDPSSGATELGSQIESLLTPKELQDIHKELGSYGYKTSEFATELPAFLTGDAIAGESLFGLDNLTNADRIRDLITRWFDGIGKLNPSSLGKFADDELATVGAGGSPPSSPDYEANKVGTEANASNAHATDSLKSAPNGPANKPLYSPDVKKWIGMGGKIDNDWTYTDWEGNVVPYPDGFPDFQSGGYVRATVEILQKGNRTSDFRNADAKSGGTKPPGTTWHHHQNGTTMQAVDIEIHRRFTHRGGVSIKKHKKDS